MTVMLNIHCNEGIDTTAISVHLLRKCYEIA